MGIYVWNRVKYVQETQIQILCTETETNIADLVTKYTKPSAHVNSKFWMEGPDYLTQPDKDWKEQRKIEYIKARQASQKDILENPEVKKEMKTKKIRTKMNFLQITKNKAKENIISKCLERSHNLVKVQRILLVCLRALLKFWKGIGRVKNMVLTTENQKDSKASTDEETENPFTLFPEANVNESSIKLSKEGIMNFVSSREDYDSGDPNSRLNSLHAKDKTMSFVSSTEDNKSTPKHSINLPNFLVDCPNIVRGCFDHSNRSFCDENNETLKLMIENEQIANWLDEMNQLKNNEDIDKSSPIFQFNPILEDNLIKMRTRLEYGDHLSEQTRFPIILPKDSPLTNLIVMNEHFQMPHCGAE